MRFTRSAGCRCGGWGLAVRRPLAVTAAPFLPTDGQRDRSSESYCHGEAASFRESASRDRRHTESVPSLRVIIPTLTRPTTNQEPSAPLTPQPDGSWPPLIHSPTN
ncbi:hypothetical protein GCM10029976_050400 [Kribbella albertanoniae]